MGLVENLRKAEHKGTTAFRRHMERAREEWADVERRLRQRMRIYPQKTKTMAASAPRSGAVPMDLEETRENEITTAEPKPIISVHGHDVKDRD